MSLSSFGELKKVGDFDVSILVMVLYASYEDVVSGDVGEGFRVFFFVIFFSCM